MRKSFWVGLMVADAGASLCSMMAVGQQKTEKPFNKQKSRSTPPNWN